MAYYFNWSLKEICELSHKERTDFCSELSKINKKVNGGETRKNIFDI